MLTGQWSGIVGSQAVLGSHRLWRVRADHYPARQQPRREPKLISPLPWTTTPPPYRPHSAPPRFRPRIHFRLLSDDPTRPRFPGAQEQ